MISISKAAIYIVFIPLAYFYCTDSSADAHSIQTRRKLSLNRLYNPQTQGEFVTQGERLIVVILSFSSIENFALF